MGPIEETFDDGIYAYSLVVIEHASHVIRQSETRINRATQF